MPGADEPAFSNVCDRVAPLFNIPPSNARTVQGVRGANVRCVRPGELSPDHEPRGAVRAGVIHQHHVWITEHRRVGVTVTAPAGRVRRMARPSKGPRGAHMYLPHPEVSRKLDALVAASGVSSVSQYVADVLALHVGLPQHVLELNRQTLVATEARVVVRRYERLMVRPHSDVSERLRGLPGDSGVSSLSQYLADFLALHVGMSQHVVELNRQEVLTLQTSA